MLLDVTAKAETIATRKASQNALQALAPLLPELLGGSADLTGSNNTKAKAQAFIGLNMEKLRSEKAAQLKGLNKLIK